MATAGNPARPTAPVRVVVRPFLESGGQQLGPEVVEAALGSERRNGAAWFLELNMINGTTEWPESAVHSKRSITERQERLQVHVC